jgi:3-hydroxyacyl-[acyl-carrier-protein] dehydratase
VRFLLVDEILDLVPGEHIRATKTMDPGEELFQDHFPGFPVVPGVLLTEMMAQAAGKCLAAEAGGRGKPMLAKIASASFRDWVAPGQVCVIEARIRSSRPRFATADCRVGVGGRVVAEASLLFSFLENGRITAGWRDQVLERYQRKSDGG